MQSEPDPLTRPFSPDRSAVPSDLNQDKSNRGGDSPFSWEGVESGDFREIVPTEPHLSAEAENESYGGVGFLTGVDAEDVNPHSFIPALHRDGTESPQQESVPTAASRGGASTGRRRGRPAGKRGG